MKYRVKVKGRVRRHSNKTVWHCLNLFLLFFLTLMCHALYYLRNMSSNILDVTFFLERKTFLFIKKLNIK